MFFYKLNLVPEDNI